MARTFPNPIALSIPLRTTWEERWQVLDDDTGEPVDLTDYEMRMQLRDRRTGALVLTLDSGGASDGTVAIEPETGLIELRVEAPVVAALSPLNRKLTAGWDAELYIPGSPEYVVPLLSGTATFTPRVTRPGEP